MKYTVVANWKMNLTQSQVTEWLNVFVHSFVPSENYSVLIAPSFPQLTMVIEKLKEFDLLSQIQVYAQDVSKYQIGSYTGEVNAANLAEIGVAGAIIGHSERRNYFHETNSDIIEKNQRLAENNLQSIVAVSEKEQVLSLSDQSAIPSFIAFEPVAAIGSGVPESVENVTDFLSRTKQYLPDGTKGMYGGSIDHENIQTYLGSDLIQGFLVGSASKNPDAFNAILQVLQ